ncbi:restriction endonuclease [Microbulbifer hainanensis]|uniref:restriction endonuclease n=1 Tax=Microbulbifer hainanensis TaxID=2735675 RepID=UPI0018675041|nr:restriction endonuclease [Microbulbifer hainanensis]
MKAWKQYQEDAAEYFRSIGLNASTDVTVKGARTKHDVDVLVTSHYVGFDITWAVECKHWKNPVNKLHVLGLREIVSDVGADRGILLSESGFQSGAIEAANLTNIQVTSLANLRDSASESIYAMRLRDLYDRIAICNDRYWDIPKEDRIEHGLRPDVGEHNYSGARVINLCTDLLTRAFRGVYPFESEDIQAFFLFRRGRQFESPKEIVEIVDAQVSELEEKLNSYEAVTLKA